MDRIAKLGGTLGLCANITGGTILTMIHLLVLIIKVSFKCCFKYQNWGNHVNLEPIFKPFKYLVVNYHIKHLVSQIGRKWFGGRHWTTYYSLFCYWFCTNTDNLDPDPPRGSNIFSNIIRILDLFLPYKKEAKKPLPFNGMKHLCMHVVCTYTTHKTYFMHCIYALT